MSILKPIELLHIRNNNNMTFKIFTIYLMINYSVMKTIMVTILFMGTYGWSQSPQEMKVLNTYVELLNESVHGLAVAQILFVNYNKDLNKYVDLESQKINTHITNAELGDNIFDNPDITTTDNNASAMKLSSLAQAQSSILDGGTARMLNGYVKEVVTVLNKINKLRFEIERFLLNNDLNDKENIYKSYELLEQAVTYFGEYAVVHDKLSSRLRKEVLYEYKPMDFVFYEVHTATNLMLNEFRKDKTTNLDKYLNRIKGAISNYKERDFNLNTNQAALSRDIVSQVEDMVRFVEKTKGSTNIPKSYKNYGINYYRHNSLLLSFFNSISPGFTSKMNKLMSERDNTFLHYDDKPILFEVTYPEKMQEIESIVTTGKVPTSSSTPTRKEVGTITPVEPEPQPVQIPQQDYVELEFYDPDLIDRDSITVTLNDEVLLENYKLESEPKKFRLDIDTHKNNAVMILAKNEGIISPNTVAFRYRFNGKGKKKKVVKRLSANQAYELVLTIEGLGGLSDK